MENTERNLSCIIVDAVHVIFHNMVIDIALSAYYRCDPQHMEHSYFCWYCWDNNSDATGQQNELATIL